MHKAGDIREDGHIFSQYSKQANGKVYEIFVPLARGGSHPPCNLQVITSIANMRKHARLEYVHNS
jgi:hypothetical protein